MTVLGTTVPYYGGGQVPNPANVITPTSAPSANLKVKLGTLAVVNSTGTIYGAASLVGGVTTWAILGGGTGAVATLTGSSGGAIAPIAGNITLAAGTGMLSTAGTAGTITFNVNFASPPAIGTGTPAAGTFTNLTGTGTINLNTTGAGVSSIGTGGTGATNIGNATGNTAVTGSLTSTGNLVASNSLAGADLTIQVTNSDNTNGASRAGVEIATGGASSGDPYLSFQISGVGASTMTMGLDNSASDIFVISNSSAIGTSNALTLTQAGALTATTTLTATLGNITATSGNLVAVAAGTGLSLPVTTASGAAGGTVNCNGRVGSVTFTGVSIAAAADLTLTMGNTSITGASTRVQFSMSGATTGAALSVKSVTPSANQLVWVITNGTGATTTTADITFDFIVLN